MTDESVIRLLLRVLCGQEWHIGERIKRWRQPKRRKKWYKKAKPFEGLTKKPVCSMRETTEQVSEDIEERGAKRQIDTSRQFCPEQECEYYGWLGRGNIVSNGVLPKNLNPSDSCAVCRCEWHRNPTGKQRAGLIGNGMDGDRMVKTVGQCACDSRGASHRGLEWRRVAAVRQRQGQVSTHSTVSA